MSIDVKFGSDLRYNIGPFTIVEDATPIDPSDSSGGYGQFTIPAQPRTGDKALTDTEVSFTDSAYGTSIGTIRQISGTRSLTTFTADSRIALTAVTRQAQPFAGTLKEAIEYYLELCGITSGIVIESWLDEEEVALVGWSAVVYDQLKKLAAAYSFEFSLVSNNIVFRAPGQREAIRYRDSQVSWSVDASDRAQSVESYYYQTEHRVAAIAYPPANNYEGAQPLQVDAGEVKEFPLEISASLSSVAQPVCLEFIPPEGTDLSAYTVTGLADGLFVPPELWNAAGGNVEVTIDDDTQGLTVKVTGANLEELGPFALALSSGDGNLYNTLHITGTGVFYDKQKLTLTACPDPDLAPEEVGATVDNEFISSHAQAFHRALWTAQRYAAPRRQISVTTRGINRQGDRGETRYMTIAEWEALYPDMTIEEFEALWPDWTAEEYEEFLDALVEGDFQNQAFGNVAGALVVEDMDQYRITTASFRPGAIQYTATEYLTIADWEAAFPDMTCAQFEAVWTTVADFESAPLRVS